MASNIDSKISEINRIYLLQNRDQWVNNLHPLVKLLLTVIFIVFTVSFDKYDLSRLIVFFVYPFVMFNVGYLSLKDALYRMRLILPLVMVVGIFNPLMDRDIILNIGSLSVSAGVVSMITLMVKGFLSVLAAYILIATTSIEDICYALRCLHVPKIIVTVVLLIYRYIFILIEEASRIMMAYTLRAPSQKGLNFKVWGPLVGQWLLRSMDKAEMVYESMCLRGFNGDFIYMPKKKATVSGIIFLIAWIMSFVVLRFTYVVELIGRLFV